MDLVCEDAKYIQFPQSFYYGGFLLGSILFGVLGDKYIRSQLLSIQGGPEKKAYFPQYVDTITIISV